MRIVWTIPALRDLTSIQAYIAQDSPSAAAQQIEAVIASVSDLLARFPQAGRNGRRANTRELVIQKTPYLVAYRLRGDTVAILRVLHGRQRWPRLPAG
ncbi:MULTISPECIES: type II toxin-antitoxin system RelE/ParE family toxin [Nitrospirillum]|uniref:type II toxin-antitoxin system RelE/ParE family toxin n=1 Tax=Nitrospirillum amazonense TaxID=28077 RepID=UPI0011A4DE91|nr:type II toxin-antitoxin system RelE/ParE family toxin [Nitrospirillum amazonense]